MENYPTWRALSYEFWGFCSIHPVVMWFALAIVVVRFVGVFINLDSLNASIRRLERRP